MENSKKYVVQNRFADKTWLPNMPFEWFRNVFEHLSASAYAHILLRDRERLFELIHGEHELEEQIQFFAAFALIFAGIYGFFLGMYSGGWQILAGMVKIPLLLFGTLLLCLPALYMFNVLLGSKLSFRQTLVVLLMTTYLMSALMASLSPIVFFFIFTTGSRHFVSLVTLITCTISGLFAIELLLKGMRYLTVKNGYPPNIRIVKIWAIVYAIVGSQLSWGLRPFIGEQGSFALFRTIEGNFYIAVFDLLRNLSGL